MTDSEVQVRIRVSTDTNIPSDWVRGQTMRWRPNAAWLEGETPPWSWLVAAPANEASQ